MNKALSERKRKAREVAAALGAPGFYADCAEQLDYARETFFDHPPILRLRDDVIPFLYDEFGHGIDHAKSVAIEAGAILLAEAAGLGGGDLRGPAGQDKNVARQLSILAQAAGLLHDVCRLEDGHAQRSAEVAATILEAYPFTPGERTVITQAVAAHEDPAYPLDALDPETRLVAAALYDADVFRWGPDAFVTILWETCDYEDWSDAEVIARFPWAMERLRTLASTFRTRVGRLYGPPMLAVGEEVARRMLADLQQYAASPSLRIIKP